MTLLDLTPRVAVSDALTALPVAVIGAGPVGLAAAAHLAERGLPFEVLEAGDEVGAAIRRWGHTRLFSPWRYLIDPAAERLLDAAGWEAPAPGRVPTGADLVASYLEPLAQTPEMAGRIRFGVTVTAVSRRGMDRTRSAGRDDTPFVLRLTERDGQVREISARAVIDASGTYASPNPLASSGLPPLGSGGADRVLHALPDVLGADRALFAGHHTTVVGAGHSAANTLLALADLAVDAPGTRVSWLIRNASAVRVTSSDDDELAHRAALGSKLDRLVAQGRVTKVDSFEISGVDECDEGVRLVGTRRGEPATHDSELVVNATGFRPDLDMLREIRLDLDEVVEAPRRLAPLIDPNLHSCGTVEPHGFDELTHPDKGFFIVGMKSYGRAPTFLLATGYEQVRSIAAWLDGDMRAATAVQLDLPATGVCSTDIGGGTCCS
ncbi:NAD(P)-binding domain-containing protein [Microbacterium aquimaris]|uniref:FAD-dependent oxidoreductase n=1 Tax=Microbacterium aquimaris TaxID=459816 RepID=UPI002AD554DA|nr:FAD-dependent oxidoreductase [Microbacterium aquimaris]MDZ8274743.1 NAD(P)-binding domain-containing protein [Microbacterium aquimaris]